MCIFSKNIGFPWVKPRSCGLTLKYIAEISCCSGEVALTSHEIDGKNFCWGAKHYVKNTSKIWTNLTTCPEKIPTSVVFTQIMNLFAELLLMPLTNASPKNLLVLISCPSIIGAGFFLLVIFFKRDFGIELHWQGNFDGL